MLTKKGNDRVVVTILELITGNGRCLFGLRSLSLSPYDYAATKTNSGRSVPVSHVLFYLLKTTKPLFS